MHVFMVFQETLPADLEELGHIAFVNQNVYLVVYITDQKPERLALAHFMEIDRTNNKGWQSFRSIVRRFNPDEAKDLIPLLDKGRVLGMLLVHVEGSNRHSTKVVREIN